MQLHKAGKDVRIYSRNGHDLSARFINIAAAMLTAPARSLVLDGELVVSDAADRPDFHALHRRSFDVGDVSVWCFDLLFLNGRELTAKPLSERKARLASLFGDYRSRRLRHSESLADAGALFAECERLGLEGIVSKKVHAPYRSQAG